MNPNNKTPEPNRPEGSAEAGTNGANGHRPTDPFAGFPGPAPIRLSPEELARIRDEVSEEEIIALLREMRETGGLELADFLPELKRAAGIDD
jgi:hypothetical protein